MQRHFDQDLANLKDRLLAMASHAENAVDKAIGALNERDDARARQVIELDSTLDQSEIELDEMCINLLALKAPIASDLRLITMAMRITQNLERVGDEATKIAKHALDLNREEPLKPLVDLPRMASLATGMLRASLDAFVRGDTALARASILRDAEVDALNKQLHRELVSYMVEDPKTITRCLNLMVISKSLERIADHATNISEEIIYLYEGREVRHLPKTQDSLGAIPAPKSNS